MINHDEFEIRILTLGPVQTNCYVLTCLQTLQTAVIDPSAEGRGIAAMLREQGLQLTHILLTHTHFDHVGGLGQLKEEFPLVPIHCHPDAVGMLTQAPMQAALFGVQMPATPAPDQMLAAGDVLHVGRLTLKVLYTPGHAPGHVSFYLADQNVLFDGDVLFAGSIGRTDLPGGDFATLIDVIQQEFLTLPDETHVLSGHGGPTTIGAERRGNPFLA